MWTINGEDITQRFGVYLRKGAYNALLSYAGSKQYLTEDVRDEDGERVFVENPRKQARSVSIPCVMTADGQTDFWSKHDDFISFLMSAGLFEFKLEVHNRIYRFYYQECGDFSALKPIKGEGSKKYCEFSLTLREPNPDIVLKESILAAEDSEIITTENEDEIIVNLKAN